MSTILVIDDEAGIRTALKDILEDEKFSVVLAEDGPIGISAFEREKIDLVILDVWLPRMGGIDVLGEMKKLKPEIPVIVISGHANIDLAVSAVKLGAYDFIEKPLSIERILTAVRNTLEITRLKEENRLLKTAVSSADTDLVGSSKAIAEVRNLAEQSAKSDARVLITGENGTGKELVARLIHAKSERSARAFVAVNCAAIPDTLIESELFGHEKGSFTDAVARRKGKFEIADSGTLFLDEVADMSPSAQAKVLRILQEMRFERLGSEQTINVDVRVIAATNKDIQKAISEGAFREDLFFRLNVIPIRMPALRERKDDIPELCEYFLRTLPQYGGSGRSFSPEGLERLTKHEWPGNIRELKNFVERVSVMSDESVISGDTVAYFLSKSVEPSRIPAERVLECGDLFSIDRLGDAKDFFEKEYLARKLKENGYNITRTAESIGIYPSNLHAKMKKYSLGADK